ncbi:MAG: NAD-dependent epimerase/dehydratase family protein, partial [Pirellulaceae bacterium]
KVVIWGSGTPRREFLHVDDLAAAVVHLLQLDDPPHWVNVGTGRDISIRELAEMVARIVGYSGQITQDPSRPDGTPVKRTDTAVINATGWQPKISLRDGIARTYECFLQESQSAPLREV